MPSYKLTYFDMKGGRGESIRLTFHSGGIPFIDERLKHDEFPTQKDKFPFGQLPILTIDDKRVIPQEVAILRYIGSLSGLYPSDRDEAVQVDVAMGLADDIYTLLIPLYGPEHPGKDAIKKLVTEERLPRFFGYLDKYLETQATTYSAGNNLTVADFRLYCAIGYVKSGRQVGLASDFLDRYPHVAKLFAAIEGHEKVSSWNTKHS